MNWDDDLFLSGEAAPSFEAPVPTPAPKPQPTPGHVYVVREPRSGAYKIGCSSHITERLNTVAAGLPSGRVTVLLTIPALDPFALEHSLHVRFRHQRISGEWFELTEQDLEKLRKEYAQD